MNNFIIAGHQWEEVDDWKGTYQCQQCMLLDHEVDDMDEPCPLGEKVHIEKLPTEKLLILASIYRAQLRYVLDNFVATEQVGTDFWMNIMDTYAARQVIDNAEHTDDVME